MSRNPTLCTARWMAHDVNINDQQSPGSDPTSCTDADAQMYQPSLFVSEESRAYCGLSAPAALPSTTMSTQPTSPTMDVREGHVVGGAAVGLLPTDAIHPLMPQNMRMPLEDGGWGGSRSMLK